jgi:hypothetical protein
VAQRLQQGRILATHDGDSDTLTAFIRPLLQIGQSW